MLFEGLQMGANKLKNRFVMAPLTRCRAYEPMDAHLPNKLMAEYYTQRASAGFIITEATMVQEKQSAFWTEPGIYNAEQVEAWKKITESVHAKEGLIFCQIWHGGRSCVPVNSGGTPCVAPSDSLNTHQVNAEFNSTGNKIPHDPPRELSDDEIEKVFIPLFEAAAKNAMAAGFDGVEIHGANGYLIDQFLRSGSNLRKTGPYAGTSLETRAKFLLDIVDKCSAAIGADRVGVRLSPLNSFNDMKDEDPEKLTAYVSKMLNDRKIAYLHMMRGDFFQAQKGDVLTPARANFQGPLIVNMGYTAEEGEEVLKKKEADLICFGTKFIANPDFVERTAAAAKLNELRAQFFYNHDAEGYIDYPFMKKE